MPVINLTPHAIVVRVGGIDKTYETSGKIARVVSPPASKGYEVEDVPVYQNVAGIVEGLPDDSHNVYIVSVVVISHPSVIGRKNVVAPGTGPADGTVRNDKNQVVAVTRFIQY
jgi:hypothetical protein